MTDKYKTRKVDGYEMRTLDLQATDGRMRRAFDWTMENSIEILMTLGFILMIYLVGMLMSTSAQAVDLMIEYAEENYELQNDQYEMQVVMEAVAKKRAEENVHPVTGAELPPYWTAPEDY